MSTYKSRNGQNIFDLALQTYGDVSRVVELFQDNDSIQDLHDDIIPGLDINFKEDQNAVRQYLIDNGIDVSTNDTNKVSGRGFDEGFDEGFK